MGKAKSPTPKVSLGIRKLSADMRQILVHIGLKCIRENDDRVEWKPDLSCNTDRAAVSRSLRRLEERGLIERFNMNGDGKRTTHVELTDAGMEAAGPFVREFIENWETVNANRVNR